MSGAITVLSLILLIGLVIVTIPSRILFPYLVAQQIGSKDRRLARLLNKIPLVRIGKRADAVSRLMKRPKNIRFMKSKYPVMYKWFTVSRFWGAKIELAFSALVLIAQLLNIAEFASNPKGEMVKMQSSAEKWNNQE